VLECDGGFLECAVVIGVHFGDRAIGQGEADGATEASAGGECGGLRFFRFGGGGFFDHGRIRRGGRHIGSDRLSGNGGRGRFGSGGLSLLAGRQEGGSCDERDGEAGVHGFI